AGGVFAHAGNASLACAQLPLTSIRSVCMAVIRPPRSSPGRLRVVPAEAGIYTSGGAARPSAGRGDGWFSTRWVTVWAGDRGIEEKTGRYEYGNQFRSHAGAI